MHPSFGHTSVYGTTTTQSEHFHHHHHHLPSNQQHSQQQQQQSLLPPVPGTTSSAAASSCTNMLTEGFLQPEEPVAPLPTPPSNFDLIATEHQSYAAAAFQSSFPEATNPTVAVTADAILPSTAQHISPNSHWDHQLSSTVLPPILNNPNQMQQQQQQQKSARNVGHTNSISALVSTQDNRVGSTAADKTVKQNPSTSISGQNKTNNLHLITDTRLKPNSTPFQYRPSQNSSKSNTPTKPSPKNNQSPAASDSSFQNDKNRNRIQPHHSETQKSSLPAIPSSRNQQNQSTPYRPIVEPSSGLNINGVKNKETDTSSKNYKNDSNNIGINNIDQNKDKNNHINDINIHTTSTIVNTNNNNNKTNNNTKINSIENNILATRSHRSTAAPIAGAGSGPNLNPQHSTVMTKPSRPATTTPSTLPGQTELLLNNSTHRLQQPLSSKPTSKNHSNSRTNDNGSVFNQDGLMSNLYQSQHQHRLRRSHYHHQSQYNSFPSGNVQSSIMMTNRSKSHNGADYPSESNNVMSNNEYGARNNHPYQSASKYPLTSTHNNPTSNSQRPMLPSVRAMTRELNLSGLGTTVNRTGYHSDYNAKLSQPVDNPATGSNHLTRTGDGVSGGNIAPLPHQSIQRSRRSRATPNAIESNYNGFADKIGGQHGSKNISAGAAMGSSDVLQKQKQIWDQSAFASNGATLYQQDQFLPSRTHSRQGTAIIPSGGTNTQNPLVSNNKHFSLPSLPSHGPSRSHAHTHAHTQHTHTTQQQKSRSVHAIVSPSATLVQSQTKTHTKHKHHQQQQHHHHTTNTTTNTSVEKKQREGASTTSRRIRHRHHYEQLKELTSPTNAVLPPTQPIVSLPPPRSTNPNINLSKLVTDSATKASPLPTSTSKPTPISAPCLRIVKSRTAHTTAAPKNPLAVRATQISNVESTPIAKETAKKDFEQRKNTSTCDTKPINKSPQPLPVLSKFPLAPSNAKRSEMAPKAQISNEKPSIDPDDMSPTRAEAELKEISNSADIERKGEKSSSSQDPDSSHQDLKPTQPEIVAIPPGPTRLERQQSENDNEREADTGVELKEKGEEETPKVRHGSNAEDKVKSNQNQDTVTYEMEISPHVSETYQVSDATHVGNEGNILSETALKVAANSSKGSNLNTPTESKAVSLETKEEAGTLTVTPKESSLLVGTDVKDSEKNLTASFYNGAEKETEFNGENVSRSTGQSSASLKADKTTPLQLLEEKQAVSPDNETINSKQDLVSKEQLNKEDVRAVTAEHSPGKHTGAGQAKASKSVSIDDKEELDEPETTESNSKPAADKNQPSSPKSPTKRPAGKGKKSSPIRKRKRPDWSHRPRKKRAKVNPAKKQILDRSEGEMETEALGEESAPSKKMTAEHGPSDETLKSLSALSSTDNPVEIKNLESEKDTTPDFQETEAAHVDVGDAPQETVETANGEVVQNTSISKADVNNVASFSHTMKKVSIQVANKTKVDVCGKIASSPLSKKIIKSAKNSAKPGKPSTVKCAKPQVVAVKADKPLRSILVTYDRSKSVRKKKTVTFAALPKRPGARGYHILPNGEAKEVGDPPLLEVMDGYSRKEPWQSNVGMTDGDDLSDITSRNQTNQTGLRSREDLSDLSDEEERILKPTRAQLQHDKRIEATKLSKFQACAFRSAPLPLGPSHVATMPRIGLPSCSLCGIQLVTDGHAHPLFNVRFIKICSTCRHHVLHKMVLLDKVAAPENSRKTEMKAQVKADLFAAVIENMVLSYRHSEAVSRNAKPAYDALKLRRGVVMADRMKRLFVPYALVPLVRCVLVDMGVNIRGGRLTWPSGPIEFDAKDAIDVIRTACPPTLEDMENGTSPCEEAWLKLFPDVEVDEKLQSCTVIKRLLNLIGVKVLDEPCKHETSKDCNICVVKVEEVSVLASMHRAAGWCMDHEVMALFAHNWDKKEPLYAVRGCDLNLAAEKVPDEWFENGCCLCGVNYDAEFYPLRFSSCSGCPRMFCSACLTNVLGGTEYIKAFKQRNYQCLHCNFRLNRSILPSNSSKNLGKKLIDTNDSTNDIASNYHDSTKSSSSESDGSNNSRNENNDYLNAASGRRNQIGDEDEVTFIKAISGLKNASDLQLAKKQLRSGKRVVTVFGNIHGHTIGSSSSSLMRRTTRAVTSGTISSDARRLGKANPIPMIKLTLKTRQELLKHGLGGETRWKAIGFAKLTESLNDRVMNNGKPLPKVGNEQICLRCKRPATFVEKVKISRKCKEANEGGDVNMENIDDDHDHEDKDDGESDEEISEEGMSEVIQCTVGNCGAVTHRQCMTGLESSRIVLEGGKRRKKAREKWRCSHHYCSVCHERDDAKMMKCRTCTRAFCRKHVPRMSDVGLCNDRLIICNQCDEFIKQPVKNVFKVGKKEAGKRTSKSKGGPVSMAMTINARQQRGELDILLKGGLQVAPHIK